MKIVEAAGAFRFKATRVSAKGERLPTMACHCFDCETMAAGAFALPVVLPAAASLVVAETTGMDGLRGGHSRHFRLRCPTSAFTRSDGMDDVLPARAPVLDNGATFLPFFGT